MARKWGVMLAIGAVLIGVWSAVCLGATQAEIDAAIEAGLDWLVSQQAADGSWPYSGEIAATGFAVLKLQDYAYEQGISPFDPDYEFSGDVLDGFEYIFGQAQIDADGVFFHNTSWGGHETYNTGVLMMTIAASLEPDRVVTTIGSAVEGWTYQEVVQACVDWFVANQNPDGGFRYGAGGGGSDNSNTGYAVLGLRYAELFGCTIPGSLKTNLDAFVDVIQCDTNGGSSYVPTSPCFWVNVLKTGNLLFEMAFVGDTMAVARAQDALAYIESEWNNMDPDVGWQPDQYQAMYCLMKGFGAMGIHTIEVGGSPVDWFQAFADAIVGSQAADGSWSGDLWGGPLLSTEWALLVLEYVIPPFEVTIDIKPGSFPNSINPAQKGVTPVAIFSTEDFDAPASIDLTTLTFGATGTEASLSYKGKGGAVPHCSFEDVDGDGLLDIVAHFVTRLCGFDVGDDTGYLKGETFSGLEIVGSDSVRIVPSYGKKDALDPMAIVQELTIQVAPNPIRDVHTAYFNVVGPMALEVDELWVQIFDLSGSLVWEEQSAEAEIAWHTNSLSGEYLANGIYIYRVLVLVDGQWVVGRLDTFAVSR